MSQEKIEVFSIGISPNNIAAFSQQQMYAPEMKRRIRSCYTFFWWHYIFLFDVTFFFDYTS